MNILVLNRGSSSIKCSLYQLENLPDNPIDPLWEKNLSWKGVIREKNAIRDLKELLKEVPIPLDEIDVVGHRIVHGGKEFKDSVIVDSSVKEKIAGLSELAPLHNIGDLEGIEFFKDKKQVAVFDTTFHQTLPDAAAIYPGPYAWIDKGIRRYGFHGISYQYCARRCAQFLSRDLKMVICHLGSGASLCAIDKGKSIDTTMGFTPLEGLMMDTRSGTVDPGILLYLMKHMKAEEISKELYHSSGLLGLSGVSSDMKEILEKNEQPRAKLALDVYIHRLNALIGQMIASLKGIDAFVFTAGIGENSSRIRKQVCEAFAFLDVKIDEAKNETMREDGPISTFDSKIKVMVIHTKEAFEIARECWRKIHG